MCGRRGQAGITMVVGLFVMFSVLGFSVDLGWAYYRKQAAQTAADASAMAAAAWANSNGAACGTNNVLCQTSSCSTLSTSSSLYAGCQYASANGFTDGSNNQTVVLQGGTGKPPNGPSNTMNYWVQATVTESVPELFLGFAGFHSATVRARATSGVGTAGGTTVTNDCIYVLDPSASEAFFASGSNTAVTLQNCSMYVNSTANSSTNQSANAYVTNGQASVTVTGAGNIQVHGGAYTDAGYCKTGFTCNATAISDPLASLPAPSFSGCDQTNYSFSSGTTTLNSSSKSVIVFCGGISINGGTVTLNPGTYVLNGGGLTIGSANTVVTGSGVTFYNTATSGHTIGAVTISGQPHVTLAAPTSGTYKGILFYQDRTTSYSTANQFNGYSAPSMTGTLYFPGSSVTFTGTNAGTPQYTAIICKDLTFNGGATFKWDNTGQYTGLSTGMTSFLMQ
jgi:Flp pilus assembly protein TadG